MISAMPREGTIDRDPLSQWLTADVMTVLDALTVDAPDIVGVMDRDLVIRWVNRTAPGLTRKRVLGRSVLDVIAHEYQDITRTTFEKVLETGIEARFETMNRSNDDVSLWDTRVGPIRFGGAVAGLIVITTDVTEPRRAHVDRDRFFVLSLDMLVVASASGHYKRVNPAFADALGYDVAELLGVHCLEFVHPEDRARTLAAFDEVVRGLRTTGFENRCRRRDGEFRVFAWRATGDPVTGDVYAVARDMTDHRKTEAQLRHAQKMDAVGQLAGGVAHDFNNLLQAVLANAELAMERAVLPEVVDSLTEILDAGHRAADLTKQLLAFSRGEPLRLVPLDLNQLLGSLMKMLRRLLPESIAIDLTRGHSLASVRAEPSQIEQVVVNLCVNARDAMDRGGRLTIATENVLLNRGYCELHPWARPGRYVLLRVTDTGVGMTPEVQEHAFEPFFTTKALHRGTGLGLSTVYAIVQQHDGIIQICSEPGQGTTFKIYLPADSRLASDAGAAIEAVPPHGQETILVAEDEPRVRRVALQILQRAGYHTLSAANGADAMRLLRERDETVHLVLLDIVMPELGGPEAWTQMQAIRPDLKVLFTSGYANPRYRQPTLTPLDILEKPFRSEDLLRRIREVLDARVSTGDALRGS